MTFSISMMIINGMESIFNFITLSVDDSKSENCIKSSTAHEELKLDGCCTGNFTDVCCAL